jgi:hypothetical protein
MQIIIFLLYVIGILSISLIVIKIADQIKKNRLLNSSKKDEKENPIAPSTTTHVPTTTYKPTTTNKPTTYKPTTTNKPTTSNKPTTTKQPIKYYKNHTLIQKSLKNKGGIEIYNKIDEYNKCETDGPLVAISDIYDNTSYYCPGIPPCYPKGTLISTSSRSGINISNPIDDYYKCCNGSNLEVVPIGQGMIQTFCP